MRLLDFDLGTGCLPGVTGAILELGDEDDMYSECKTTALRRGPRWILAGGKRVVVIWLAEAQRSLDMSRDCNQSSCSLVTVLYEISLLLLMKIIVS